MRRLGLDRFEHGAILSWTGSGSHYWSARSILCGAVVRLAHQLISGSSGTACHNPACTAQMIEETGSHFLPARETPIVSSTPVAPPLEPYAGPQTLRSALPLCGNALWFGSGEEYSLGNEAGLDITPERDCELAGQGDQHDPPDPT